MKPQAHHLKELAHIFSSLKDEKEAMMVMKDIFTPQEIASLAERWELIKALHQGTPQRKISKTLGISISKITRGSRVLKFGEGGFELLLKRMEVKKGKKEEAPKKEEPKKEEGTKKRWGLFRRRK